MSRTAFILSTLTVALSITLSTPLPLLSVESYDLVFSTYYGGTGWEHVRDVCADESGNVYIVGGTASADFPTTHGAYDRTFASGGSDLGSAGPCDAFVVKFDADGNRLWATYVGGDNYDRAYAVEVDDQGYVYISGRAGPGFPVTAGVFQPTFEGTDNGIYGRQNAFVAKLEPDGSDLAWASYIGVGQLARDFALDDQGDLYVNISYTGAGSTPPAAWFAGSYLPTPQGGLDCGVAKVSGDGTQVYWATFLGGSANDHQEASIRVDASGHVYAGFSTYSTDVETTAGVCSRTQGVTSISSSPSWSRTAPTSSTAPT